MTTTNAMHYAYQASGDDLTRRLLMLQNAAFLTLFREALGGRGKTSEARIDQLEPAEHLEAEGLRRGRSRRSSPRPATTRWPRRGRRWPTSRPGTSPSR